MVCGRESENRLVRRWMTWQVASHAAHEGPIGMDFGRDGPSRLSALGSLKEPKGVRLAL